MAEVKGSYKPMNFSAKACYLAGIILLIAAMSGFSAAVSIHPPLSSLTMLSVQLPPAGSQVALTTEQLAEMRSDSHAGFHFRLTCLEIFVDALFLGGIILLVTGAVKSSRKRQLTGKLRAPTVPHD